MENFLLNVFFLCEHVCMCQFAMLSTLTLGIVRCTDPGPRSWATDASGSSQHLVKNYSWVSTGHESNKCLTEMNGIPRIY